jgi:retron-type reverse transcriptase
MRVERRGCVIRFYQWVNLRGEELVSKTKPFAISKRAVWEAYRQVKENRGAAGVDRQSLEDFEHDLANNLYKLWNRLASGSYFPPPVLAVEIPKAQGGRRRLGIPVPVSYCTSLQVTLGLIDKGQCGSWPWLSIA